MLTHKKRRYNNYLYTPDPINKTNKNIVEDVDTKPKPNINMWDAVKNTHCINRAGLNVAYKKDNSITNIGNKAFIAGTKSKRRKYLVQECFFSIQNWKRTGCKKY